MRGSNPRPNGSITPIINKNWTPRAGSNCRSRFCRPLPYQAWLLGVVIWVNGGVRTHGHQNHNLALCQLSYVHHLYLFAEFMLGLHESNMYFLVQSQTCVRHTEPHFVASEGFEPSLSDPESPVLPLHQEA